MPSAASAWHLYVVRCRGGELYTGIARDVERRLAEHESSPRGAKYLRGRGPFTLVLARRIGGRAEAHRVEIAFKKLHKEEKESLVRHPRRAGAWVRAATRPEPPGRGPVVDS